MGILETAIHRARAISHVLPPKIDLRIRCENLAAEVASLRAENTALKAMFRTPDGCPSIQYILTTVSRFFQIPIGDLLSARRDHHAVRPRHIAVYLARTLTLHSFPTIGRHIGDRDHTTILSSFRKIESERRTNTELNANIRELTAQLLKRPVKKCEKVSNLQNNATSAETNQHIDAA